ncbi:MAG: hypothetical protein IJL63_06695 [Clostridia bacterium]|nr:hypothetical protein [Clostridia bacterium]
MRQFQIERPNKCKSCPKRNTCTLFDITEYNIFSNMKAFYKVFQNLEKKVDKKETDYISLTPVMITNGTLAAELAIKLLTYKEKHTFECTHELIELYNNLPKTYKNPLSDLLKSQIHLDDIGLEESIKDISDFFVDWRYSFTRLVNGYSHFLCEFIHIVCDYAIEQNEFVETSETV